MGLEGTPVMSGPLLRNNPMRTCCVHFRNGTQEEEAKLVHPLGWQIISIVVRKTNSEASEPGGSLSS